MNALQLIAKLGAAGIKLWLDEEQQLRFKAPKGALTADLKAQLIEAKADVIKVLAQSQQAEQERIPVIERNDDTRLKLSFAQQRLWFLDRLDPGNPSYHIVAALKMTGPLQVELLQKAFQTIVDRHESLRTTFLFKDNEVSQVIKPSSDWPLAENYDLSGLLPKQQDSRLQEIAEDEALRSFDLTDGTSSRYRRVRLLRTRLARLTNTSSSKPEHVLFITLHHIIADGWSIGVLIKELSSLYHAYLEGEASPLAPLDIQYADFAAWQHEWLAGDNIQQQLSYWKTQLNNTSLLELPTDFARPAVMRNRGANIRFELPLSVSQKLQHHAKSQGKTLFMVLMTAFQILLKRYSGQSDICVGTPVANRNRPQIEPLIGCFINTVAIRADLEQNPSFNTLLTQVSQTIVDAYANQDVPFEQLVDEITTSRDQSFTPIYQVMFSLENGALDYALSLDELSIERLPLNSHTAKYDLQLHVTEAVGENGNALTDQPLSGEIEYNTDLFKADTIQRLSQHFVCLLESILENPDLPLHQLNMLSHTERAQLIGIEPGQCNDTSKHYGDIPALHALFEHQVAQNPDRPAVSDKHNTLTYQQLNERVNQLAHHLRNLGVDRDQLVGVCMERSVELSIALLAIHKAGGAYVPFDPNFPAERLAFMAEDTQIKVLLTQSHLSERTAPLNNLHILTLDADTQAWAGEPITNLGIHNQPNDLFNVIYTSGSTGKPKGVMVPHQGIINRLLWMQEAYPLDASDRVLQKTPYSFDVSVWELFWPLIVGSHLIYAKPEGHKDPEYLKHTVIEKRITTLHFVPSMLGLFLQTPQIGQCTSIKRVFSSGEALPVEYERRFFECLAKAELHNLYGPTEASIDVSYYACKPKSTYSSVPIGKPVANTQLHVLDSQLKPVPFGVVGELYLGGVQLARGYLNRDDLTQSTFINNPFHAAGHPSPRLYKTGDLARIHTDGNVEYMGRIDHQVKVRGFRIELGEIEAVIARAEQVQDVAVSTYKASDGNTLLAGYIVLAENANSDDISNKLRESVRAELPEYMVPNRFIVLDELPLSANGKLDRKRLPVPSQESASTTDYVAPDTSTETLLCELWCEALNLERIGIKDNFFELGGHSLLATKLVSRISESFDIDLPLRALFDHPTVRALAVKIEEASGLARRPAITQADRSQPLPMSMAQERLWIIEQLSPGNTAYNMPAALRLSGHVDTDILGQALDQLVQRHESLRTYFASDSQGIGLQVIQTDNLARLSVENIDGDLAEIDASVQKYLDEEANTPFELTTGPLFRARLIALGEQDNLLLINMHHIISDGWSISILQREWVAIYNALSACTPLELPELSVQYTDYAQWQRQWLNADVQKLNLDFWLDNLADAPQCLTLPLDRPRPQQQSFAGASYQFRLDNDQTQALKQFSQVQGNTLYTSLLASFGLLLSRYSGQDDVCIGTPVAGRQDSALEGLIGYFINTVVIRGDLSGNPSVSQLLERYKQCSLNAFAHQDIPIEKVLDALPIERNISYPPVAQVGFNFINADIAQMPTQLGDASVEYIESQKVVAKYDLTLIFIETENGLEATAEYNSDLFDASTIETMMQHYQRLVEQFVASADQPIDTLALLHTDELYSAVGVDPSEYEDVRALTPMQRDLYLNTQVNPEGLSNNLGYHVFVDGVLDTEIWRQACEKIANEHPVLRTDIIDSTLRMGDIAYQCIAKQRRVNLEIIDLRNQAPAEKDVHHAINQLIYRPFALYSAGQANTGHLTRYALILVSEKQSVAVTAMHHAITDGVSLAMQGQLALRTYRELSGEDTANTASEALEIGDQFTHYSQAIGLKTDLASTREFWQERLAQVQGLQCPTPIRLEPEQQTSTRRYSSVSMGSEQWAELKRFCRKQRITPALYFKCLYGLLINQYCRPEGDFAITEFNAGRDRQTQFSFGCFFQQTPFVFEQDAIATTSSIQSLLAYARQFQKAAKPHQPASIMLQHKLQPQGGLQFMYNYYHFFPTTELIDGKPVHHQEYPPLVDSAIQFISKELPDGCKLDLLFETDTFLGDDLLARLMSLNEQIVGKGVESLNQLSYVTPQEYQQQVIDWNQTQVELPENHSVQSLIEAQVAKTPDAIAIISDDTQLSYHELNEQANQLAHYLRHQGVGSDVRVGIGLARGAQFVVSVLAVIKAGGAYVPVDASYPKERINYMLKDAHAPILICHRDLHNQLEQYQGKILCLDEPELQQKLAEQPTGNPVDQTDIDDLLYIIYTSGSTGKPKGAGVIHKGELNLLNWYTREAEFDTSTRCLVISSVGFDLTQKNLFAPLVSGGTLVIPHMPHYDGDAISRLIEQEGITLINCAPSAFYPLVEDNPQFDRLCSIKQLIMGGEPIRIERLAPWLESSNCNATLVNNYGPTECTDIAAFERIDNPLNLINQAVPIGKPNDNVQLYILNDHNQLLPTGAVGELCIAGLGVGRGYLNHDELNLEKFIANPLGDGQLYRTGDLVRYRPDGKLDFIGRKDFQVKLNGLRIELGEIEFALREQSDVNDALATVTDNTLVAYATFNQSESLDPRQRTQRWTQSLRDYLPTHMVPSIIIALEQWPLTPNGKIDRKALPNPADHTQNQREYVAPRNDIEQQLAAILCHVLGLSRVGVHDDFFDIGGHSLAASRAITQIRDIFNIEIPLNVLFEKTTIEGLAEYISVSQWAANNANTAEISEDEGPREEGFL